MTESNHKASDRKRERRYFTRIDFDADAKINTEQDSHQANLIDISLSGASVKAKEQLQRDQMVKLAVSLCEDVAPIDLKAKVVHVDGDQYGLRFVSYPYDSVVTLKRLMELNLPEPAILRQEVRILHALQSK